MERKSIRYALNELVIIPLICLGVIVLVVSIPVIYSAITTETEEGLKNLSHSLMETCNVMGDGDYILEDNVLKKGDNPFGEDNDVVDRVYEVSGIDATIFWQDIRMITTVKTENGERAVGTRASEEVTKKVLENGEEYFSSRVEVNGTAYYGYYVPLKNGDDSIVGMVFVGKSRETIMRTIMTIILRVFFAAALIIAVATAIALKYARGIVESLSKIKGFLGNVAEGDLECELDKSLICRKDEIGEMGHFAQMLQKSILKSVGTDPLTGLYNRRSCNETLEKCIYKYERNGKKYAVAMGDIDNFKRLNDVYGHQAGDMVLTKISEIFQEAMKGKGIAARWGGEEFLLVYKKDDPLADVEQILEAIRNLEIRYKQDVIRVTMTFGVSVCRQEDTIESITKRADERLYQGKANGKNQIVR